MLLASRLAEGSSGPVNLKDGSFHLDFANIANSKLLAGIDANYSSRRLGRGLLGPGWCTNLDIEIRRGRGTNLEIQNCDHVLHFTPLPGANLTDPQVQVYQLQQDSPVEYRLEQSTDSTHLVRRERTLEGLTTTIWVFNKIGQLISLMADQDGLRKNQIVVLSRRREGLRLQLNSQLVDVQLSLGPDGFPRMGKLSGRQECHRFLWQKNVFVGLQDCGPESAALQMEFDYDVNGNMTHLKRTETEMWLNYDSRWDRVTEIRERADCYEQFKYETSIPTPPPQGLANLTSTTSQWKVCPASETLQVRLEIQALVAPQGQTVLRRLVRHTAKQTIHLDFHPLTGQWVGRKIIQNKQSDSDFNPRSRLKTRMASE